MNNSHTMEVIARMHSVFPEKFGIPRQSGLVESLRGTIVFEESYRNPDALRGIEGFSHLWLIWQFSENAADAPCRWSPTVRPPRLGGNVRMGVFATRSPFRPNPIGLSCVRLLGVEQDAKHGSVLVVGGADLMDGTPIYDIKPYIPYADSHPAARGGFAPAAPAPRLRVEVPPELLRRIPETERDGLCGALAQDPRPAYQRDDARVYGMRYGAYTVRFRVEGETVYIVEIQEEQTE